MSRKLIVDGIDIKIFQVDCSGNDDIAGILDVKIAQLEQFQRAAHFFPVHMGSETENQDDVPGRLFFLTI